MAGFPRLGLRDHIFFWLTVEVVTFFLLSIFKQLALTPILSQSRNVSLCIYVPFSCNFHQLGRLGRVGLVVAMSVCCRCLSPSHAIFFEASHWPCDHMISSRPLIGQPSPPPPPPHSSSSNLYQSHYPHRSRELVSPVCGICFQEYSRGFPGVFSGFFWVFPGFSQGFPGFSLVFPRFSRGFPGIFFSFPLFFLFLRKITQLLSLSKKNR